MNFLHFHEEIILPNAQIPYAERVYPFQLHEILLFLSICASCSSRINKKLGNNGLQALWWNIFKGYYKRQMRWASLTSLKTFVSIYRRDGLRTGMRSPQGRLLHWSGAVLLSQCMSTYPPWGNWGSMWIKDFFSIILFFLFYTFWIKDSGELRLTEVYYKSRQLYVLYKLQLLTELCKSAYLLL